MDYDLEDRVLIRKEGKKKARGEIEDVTAKKEISILVTRNRRVVEANQVISVAAKRQRGDINIRLQSYSKSHIDVEIEDIKE
ncbi:hypothetical protein Goarm_006815, partial [Gossypium armourianum]|nr:hypothetical protein [Gossypium armourianum]